LLRANEFEFSTILLITAACYATGKIGFYFLMPDYRKREVKGLVDLKVA